VKGSSPQRASTYPAALTAATKVEKFGLPAAMSTMALDVSKKGSSSTADASVGMAAGSTTATAGTQAASTSARTIIW